MAISKKRLLGWKKTRGEKNKQAKLTNNMARAMRRAYTARKLRRPGEHYFTLKWLGQIYGVSVSTVWRVIHKQSYKESKFNHDSPKEECLT